MPVEEIRLTIIAGKQFVVALEPENGGGFHVYCPELRGCHAFGIDEEDAVENIQQAISQYLNELVARYGQAEGIVIIPGENIFPEDGPVPEKTLRAIAADLGMSIEEFAALADAPPGGDEENA